MTYKNLVMFALFSLALLLLGCPVATPPSEPDAGSTVSADASKTADVAKAAKPLDVGVAPTAAADGGTK